MRWIKLYDKLLTSPIWDNPQAVKFWLWCLLRATWREHTMMVGRNLVTLQPGQFLTSIRKAHEQSGISPRSIRTYMKLFEKLGMLRAETTHKTTQLGTLVTIVNWERYQGDGEPGDTSSDTPGDTPGDTKSRRGKKGVVGKVLWDADSETFQIPPEVLAQWQKSYPHADVPAEVSLAQQWYRDYPTRRKKSHRAFLARWISRTNTKAKAAAEARDALMPERQLTEAELNDLLGDDRVRGPMSETDKARLRAEGHPIL